MAAYEQALVLSPDDADARYGTGAALQNLARSKEALAAYERTLTIDPNHALARSNKIALEQQIRQAEIGRPAEIGEKRSGWFRKIFPMKP